MVATSWTFVGGENTLVGVFTVIGVEFDAAVESILRSVAFVWVQIPVGVTTVSHLAFAIASQVVTVAKGFGIAAIIGGLCASAFMISLMEDCFFLSVGFRKPPRRNWLSTVPSNRIRLGS
jgi:hypothetical protein